MPDVVTAIDLASVHAGAVSIRDSVGVMSDLVDITEGSWEVPTKDYPGPLHARVMATNLSEFCRMAAYPLGAYHLVLVEDTYFGGVTSGGSSTGEIRGILYERFRAGMFHQHICADRALLVSPSRWRGYHGLSGATKKEKVPAYAARAESLGFVSQALTKRMREDATAAFLLAVYGVALLAFERAGVPATTREDKNLERLLNDPAARIYP